MSGIAAQISKDKTKAQGLGTPDKPVKYLDQDYEELRAKCLKAKRSFEDSQFPPIERSFGVNKLGPKSEKGKNVVWKRAKDMHSDPQFIVNGATREDVKQGKLGNCWFMATIAALTENQDFLSIVVPGNQSFQNEYAGIFHFKFWQYGEWVDVVVDDYLPTKSGKLIFMKSLSGNEFWGALLEKAYAKLHDSYEALIPNHSTESMQDFTGGTIEIYYMTYPLKNLPNIIRKRIEGNSLLTCFSSRAVSENSASSKEAGVRLEHAYTIIGMEEVSYQGSKVTLIKLRNLWGAGEWTGAWSDNAPEWEKVDPNIRYTLNKRSEDGEFWMSFPDFMKHYRRVDICNINLSSAINTKDKHWHETQFSGRWRKGSTAGGNKDDETFWANPQFWSTLDTPDHECRGSSNEPCCRVIISLMQKDSRQKSLLKLDILFIGFCVYKVAKSPNNQLDKTFFDNQKPVAVQKCLPHREVSDVIKLPVGTYLIVPHTSRPNLEADFHLRVFTEKRIGAFGDIDSGVILSVDKVIPARKPNIARSPVGDPIVERELIPPRKPEVSFCGVRDPVVELIPPRKPEVAFCPGGVPVVERELIPRRKAEVAFCPGGVPIVEREKNELDVNNLKTVLNKCLSQRCDLKSEGLSLTTCREIINLFDMDRTGTLSVEEFKILWKTLEEHMEIFKVMDVDGSGSMDAFEMRKALRNAGFRLGSKVHDVIVQKYASSDLTIKFDEFISCVMRLQTLFKMFALLDTNQSGFITLSLSEWLCAALA